MRIMNIVVWTGLISYSTGCGSAPSNNENPPKTTQEPKAQPAVVASPNTGGKDPMTPLSLPGPQTGVSATPGGPEIAAPVPPLSKDAPVGTPKLPGEFPKPPEGPKPPDGSGLPKLPDPK